jgi:hypothetical protein
VCLGFIEHASAVVEHLQECRCAKARNGEPYSGGSQFDCPTRMHVGASGDAFALRVRIRECAERLMVLRIPALRAALRKEVAAQILALRETAAPVQDPDRRNGLAR